ncbi:keto-deoxy-phosphogluconate aldolase [Endozoicomonas sp. (ex Bugula neritina AB1)]|nr:keto-deoxy-phosphogluconate aldolase [Endozoicomonas sp. (ex Bugula neritina AB1)]
MNAEDILDAAHPVMPVIVLDNIEQALPLAQALYDGGVKALEITLRSDCALEAITFLKKEMPADCIVGAGTVLNGEQFHQVVAAGGDFVVTPGTTRELLDAAAETGLPFIPGVSNPSQAMEALSAGFKFQKFFPAEQAGGIAMLKAMSGPLGEISFCPTGGINSVNFKEYLDLPTVKCVGGSWIAPMNLVRSGDWTAITELCKAL